ncbi:MAG: hypothetical protein JEZ08_14840 [Clostridiales bacterium]|nr:hypothetical protein [Clostridiales bacterium]
MKKWLCILMTLSIMLTGCQDEIAATENNTLEIIEKQEKDSSNKLSNLNSNEEAANAFEEEEYELEPWTVELYIGMDADELSEEQIVMVQEYLDQINSLEQEDMDLNEDEIFELYDSLDQLLSEFGLCMPLTSMASVVSLYPDLFTENDLEKLDELEQIILELNESDPESEQLETTYDELISLLDDKGLYGEDLVNQVEMQSIDLAVFNVVDGKISLRKDSVKSKTEITEKEMKDYEMLWHQTKKIVPKSHMEMLKLFVINTDGRDNVLAYVNQENDELTKWRMVLDIKDALDSDGKYIKEYNETIVHEFAHIMTLNATQMQEPVEDDDTYVGDEGATTKSSYLNQFYQKFWTDIYEEHQNNVDQLDETGDSAYAFYEKYENHFVSDYAATNPEEDIAETFSVFVFTDKPAGSEIKDQKILFMYGDDSLVKLRQDIRYNLNLE